MLPIFNGYIEYLKNNGVDLPLKEGIYWLDNAIIKAFDKDGIERKVYKIITNDDLTITYKTFCIPTKVLNSGFETWEETINRNKKRLDSLELESIDLIRDRCEKYNGYKYVILNSTGKDSMVVRHLASKSGYHFDCYLTNSTIEYGESVKMAKRLGFTFMHPQKERSFFEWQKRTNFIPTKLYRTCCTYFQERPTIEYFDKGDRIFFMLGMRREESKTRSQYDFDWRNPVWGKNRPWEGLLPVLKWTEADIWLYTLREGIEFNNLYRKGYSRVGWILRLTINPLNCWNALRALLTTT